MKNRERPGHRQKRSTKRLADVPVLQKTVECPSCGGEIELWACDEGAQCMWCGYLIITRCRRMH